MSDTTSCSVEPEELSAFIDEELSDERMEELRSHVRGCDLCSQRVSRLRESRRVVRLADVPSAPDTFVSDVRERVENRSTKEDSGPTRQRDDRDETTGVGSYGNRGEGASGDDSIEEPWYAGPEAIAAAAAVFIVTMAGLFVVRQYTVREQRDVSGRQVAMEEPSGSKEKQAQRSPETPTGDGAAVGGSTDRDEAVEEVEQAGQKRPSDKRKDPSVRTEEEERPQLNTELASSGQSKQVIKPSPILIRLRGERVSLVEELTTAFSVLDRDGVEPRAFFPAEEKQTADDRRSAEAGRDADEKGQTETVRTLSTDLSSNQLSSLLKQNATLELTLRADRAKLFLGALVQQGQSPDVLTVDPERSGRSTQFALKKNVESEEHPEEEQGEKQVRENEGGRTEDSEEGVRQTVVSLQQFNQRLQQSRLEWGQQASGTDSGSRTPGDAISISTLRRSLRQYEEARNEKTDESPELSDVLSDGSDATEKKSDQVLERRNVLLQWVAFLEDRPVTGSAEVEQEEESNLNQLDDDQEHELNRASKQRASRDYVDIHLRITGGMTAPDGQLKKEGEKEQEK